MRWPFLDNIYLDCEIFPLRYAAIEMELRRQSLLFIKE